MSCTQLLFAPCLTQCWFERFSFPLLILPFDPSVWLCQRYTFFLPHSSLLPISLFDKMLGAFIAILALTGYANAHGFIIDIKGANGKTSNGFGVGSAPFKVCGR